MGHRETGEPCISDIRPTVEQMRILDAVRDTKDNMLISARAGAAKTTTLKLAADRLVGYRVLSVAFNKRIADELTKRFPKFAVCATLNSIGHRAWANALDCKIIFDPNKAQKIVADFARTQRYAIDTYQLRDALNQARNFGYTPVKSKFPSICDRERFLDWLDTKLDEPLGAMGRIALDAVIERSTAAAYRGLIDYADQIYLPAVIGGRFDFFDVIMVDEVQDFTELNHRMLERMSTPADPNHRPSRIIAVGDAKQSIYSFRAAMPDAMERMQKSFNMKLFPLTISFRCAQAIVRRAQTHAPDMRPTTRAPEGEVKSMGPWGPKTIPAGAFVICRNNAPLYDLGTKLLRAGVPVQVVGTQLGASLVRDLRALGDLGMNRDAAIRALEWWAAKKRTSIKPEAEDQFNDRVESLATLLRQSASLRDAIALAENLSNKEGRITLMTGHKSKGLEADTVIHLDPWRIPSPMARDDVAIEQEKNLAYVIDTRAKLRLWLANSRDYDPAR